VDLKDPRPAPPGSGEPGERPRLHGRTTSGHGNGAAGKKELGVKEKCMDSNSLAIKITYRIS